MRLPPSLRVEDWPLARLRVDGRNPRTHPPSQIRKIAASIRRFGWTNPILAEPDGLIIAGEGRWLAARELRRKTVPVIVLGHLTAAEREAYRVADNRIPLDAGWNEELLRQVIADLQGMDFALPVLGFTDDELRALLEDAGIGAPAPDEPPAAPLPAEPVTRPGDIWELGRHRLICGDSTRAETLAALMGGEAPELVFTDPPYGMAYEGGRARRRMADLVFTDPPYGMEYEQRLHRADMVFTDPPYGMSFGAGKAAGSTAKGALVKAHGMIMGDDARGDALVSLVGRALAQAREHAKPGAAFYVCFTWRTYAEFLRGLVEAGLKPAACIVWDKGSIGLGFQHYRPRHEFIFYCAGERWYGGLSEGDVWTFSRGRTEAYVHPTQKPVDLVERAIVNSSLPGDVVLDVFGGSGSTLIACERTGRAARLVELDPKYCDAIVRRWERVSGLEGNIVAA